MNALILYVLLGCPFLPSWSEVRAAFGQVPPNIAAQSNADLYPDGDPDGDGITNDVREFDGGIRAGYRAEAMWRGPQ